MDRKPAWSKTRDGLDLLLTDQTLPSRRQAHQTSVSCLVAGVHGRAPAACAGVVADMWRAGVWPLALMIAYAGGLWGYVKGLGLLVCWFVPRTVLSAQQCERVLMGLELIGVPERSQRLAHLFPDEAVPSDASGFVVKFFCCCGIFENVQCAICF